MKKEIRKKNTMKSDTLIALKESIKKWERIAKGTGEDNGSGNCELCHRFEAGTCEFNKETCPVEIAVGEGGCRKTPFITWQNHQANAHGISDFPHKIQKNCKRCVELAKKEVNFLKSLLPVKRKRVVVNVFHEKEPFDLVIKFIGEDGR